MAHLLGLDISTTGAKAILIDEGGQVVATHTTPQPISTPHPLWSEQNPADWWDGIAASIRAVLDETNHPEIAAVGLTGQMHGLVLLDAGGKVLRPRFSGTISARKNSVMRSPSGSASLA